MAGQCATAVWRRLPPRPSLFMVGLKHPDQAAGIPAEHTQIGASRLTLWCQCVGVQRTAHNRAGFTGDLAHERGIGNVFDKDACRPLLAREIGDTGNIPRGWVGLTRTPTYEMKRRT